ncbi:uncharacterized protein SAPINGB_P000710 [Magnusiomyces paraingens]|uniref:RNase MRP protein 1 RNA binding domain-containing protein n=1 Tax=Magnusiomyces paraingens TaxID=2606893 RepID=A0A5E8B223_9ASCO|nr:uncharacterized protein SAPINGB_P000710 [Saprochaete ingens]VVT45318.1 unnamed protein product [Saprochaete ingens]
MPDFNIKNEVCLNFSDFDLSSFKDEVDVLRLILYRNKNQHRVWRWWRYIEMIAKHCYQLIDIIEKQNRLEKTCPKGFSKLRNKKGLKRKHEPSNLSKRAIKRKEKCDARIKYFEKVEKAELDKAHRENDENADITKIDLAHKNQNDEHIKYIPPGTQSRFKQAYKISLLLHEKLIPTAYRSFHRQIFALAFFITLGFGLLGSISKIFSMVETLVLQCGRIKSESTREIAQSMISLQKAGIDNVKQKVNQKKDAQILEDEENTNEDIGEKVSLEDLQKFLKNEDENKIVDNSSIKPSENPSTFEDLKQSEVTTKKITKVKQKKRKRIDQEEEATEPTLAKTKKSRKSQDLQPNDQNTSTEKKQKKKKKKASEIDDIFGGLL